jgi:hypothetical protein
MARDGSAQHDVIATQRPRSLGHAGDLDPVFLLALGQM